MKGARLNSPTPERACLQLTHPTGSVHLELRTRDEIVASHPEIAEGADIHPVLVSLGKGGILGAAAKVNIAGALVSRLCLDPVSNARNKGLVSDNDSSSEVGGDL